MNGCPELMPPLCKGRWQPKADGGIVLDRQHQQNHTVTHEAGRGECPLQPNCSHHQRRLTSRRLFERFARRKTHHVTYGDTSRRLCRHIMLPKGVHHVAEGNTFAPRRSFNAFSLKQKAKEKALQKERPLSRVTTLDPSNFLKKV